MTGDISTADLGVTACHEHVVLGLGYSGQSEDVLTPERVKDDLDVFMSLGGRTIVELTTEGMGRDPRALRALAEGSGLHIVCSTGFYQQ
ncbi:MAG TPA: hypothetical protein VGK53_05620, partial [Propionicimonas sp.]